MMVKVCKRCNKKIVDTYNKHRNYHHSCKLEHSKEQEVIKAKILANKQK